MAYEIEFTQDGSSITLPPDNLRTIELPAEHSVINEWEVAIPASPGFEEWAGAEAYIRYSGSLVYRGELESVETSKQSGETILRGTDTTRKLKRGGADVRFQSIPVWRAIDQYISNQTGFKGEVHEPTADTVDADKVVHSSADPISDYFNPSSDSPFGFDANGNLELLQSCFTIEGEDYNSSDVLNTASNSNYSDGSAPEIFNDNEYIEWQITPQYDIPSEYVGIAVRAQNLQNEESDVDWYFNGDHIDNVSQSTVSNIAWVDVGVGGYGGGDGYTGADLSAGTTYTLRAEDTGAVSYSVSGESWTADVGSWVALDHAHIVSDSEKVYDGSTTYTRGTDYEMDYTAGEIKALSGGSISDGQSLSVDYDYDPDSDYAVDVVAVYDTRYSYVFDNDNGGSGGYLDGPELYPVDSIRSVQHKDNYNIEKASVTTTFNDLSGGQAIQASNDGGTTHIPSDGTEENTDSIDVRFSTTYGSLAESKLTLSRYGSRTTATPQEGYQGQSVSSYELSITTNDLAVINDRTYTGSGYENLQELHKDGGMRFVVPPDENEDRVISFATGEIVQDETWKTIDYTRSVDTHEYANTVTAYGGKDANGNRLKATAKDQTAISNDGEEIPAPPLFEPRIDNEDDLRGAARTGLSKRVGSDRLSGSVDIAPKRILPGYSYHVPELGETLALERVTYRIGVDDTGSLDFEGVTDLATEFSRISAGVKSVKDAF